MTRRLDARAAAGGDNADRSEALRLIGPPKETITLTIEIDATDGLETQDPLAATYGRLSHARRARNAPLPEARHGHRQHRRGGDGVIEIVPPDGPLTVLVWGPRRVVPVQAHGLQHHRGGVRPEPEPDPSQGGPHPPGPQLLRPPAHQPRVQPLPRAPDPPRKSLAVSNVNVNGDRQSRRLAQLLNDRHRARGDRHHDLPQQPISGTSATATWTGPDGRDHRYLLRRFLPDAVGHGRARHHVVTQGDRLDNITAQFLGDPEQFWRVCDANNAMGPDDLDRRSAAHSLIPLPQKG